MSPQVTHHSLSILDVHLFYLLILCWVISILERVMMSLFPNTSSLGGHVRTTLKNAYDMIRDNLDAAQKKRKEGKDKHACMVCG